MTRLVAAGGSDVGRLREGNEDAFLVRDGVFAVADGMGGHLAGEVASAVALEPIAELDGRVFAGAAEAVGALRAAVLEANRRVAALADERPEFRGMGTTLTAALLEGRRLHVAHVGDSRAYLLRAGRFRQLTDDHTLVQGLIDDGQLTPEEAEVHPHRSVVTRAIGVAHEVDVDAMTIELEHGDRLVLCSDGLTGVVGDADLAQEVADADPAELGATIRRLIDLANAGGGPDNITVVLLGFDDPDAPPVARRGRITIDSRAPARDASQWAEDYVRLGAGGLHGGRRASGLITGRAAPGGAVAGRGADAGRVVGRTFGIALGVALLVGIVVGGARFLLDRAFYVGVDEGEIVIYQGIAYEVGPFSLSRVRERTGVLLTDIPAYVRPSYEEGRPAVDLTDARRMVESVPRTEQGATDADDDAGAP